MSKALSKLFSNPAIKNVLMKQFKSIMQSGDVKFIGINITDEGDPVPETYEKEMIVVEKETMKAIIEKIKRLESENISLTAKIEIANKLLADKPVPNE